MRAALAPSLLPASSPIAERGSPTVVFLASTFSCAHSINILTIAHNLILSRVHSLCTPIRRHAQSTTSAQRCPVLPNHSILLDLALHCLHPHTPRHPVPPRAPTHTAHTGPHQARSPLRLPDSRPRSPRLRLRDAPQQPPHPHRPRRRRGAPRPRPHAQVPSPRAAGRRAAGQPDEGPARILRGTGRGA